MERRTIDDNDAKDAIQHIGLTVARQKQQNPVLNFKLV